MYVRTYSTSGRGTYLELGGYLNSLDTFVWRKLQSYRVTLKIGGLQPLTPPFLLLMYSTAQLQGHIYSRETHVNLMLAL